MRATAIVVLVSALFASTAAVSVRSQQRWTGKLDAALSQAVKQGGDSSVRALVHLRPGTTDQFISHVRQHGLRAARVTADVITVELPATMLRWIAPDRDVVRLSSDAVVQGLAAH